MTCDRAGCMTVAEQLRLALATLDRIATSPHREDAPLVAQRTLNQLTKESS